MSKFFCIMGDPERGNEIAALFGMFRVANTHGYAFNNSTNAYTVDNHCVVTTGIDVAHDNNCKVFTLDEFNKKYPFKVGDKVKYKPLMPIINAYVEATIINMEWTGEEVLYVTSNAHCLLVEQLEKN